MSRERFDHPLAPRTDDLLALEDELRRALAIEPSPDFARQVRTRIAKKPPTPWMSWSGLRPALAAAAIGAIAIGLGWTMWPGSPEMDGRVGRVGRVGSSAAVAPGPTGSSSPSTSSVSSGSPASAGAAVVSRVTRTARHVERAVPVREEPEVLVPPDRALAIARVLELARAGAFEDAPPPPAGTGAGPLEVVPIVVPSIPIANVEIQTGATSGAGGK